MLGAGTGPSSRLDAAAIREVPAELRRLLIVDGARLLHAESADLAPAKATATATAAPTTAAPSALRWAATRPVRAPAAAECPLPRSLDRGRRGRRPSLHSRRRRGGRLLLHWRRFRSGRLLLHLRCLRSRRRLLRLRCFRGRLLLLGLRRYVSSRFLFRLRRLLLGFPFFWIQTALTSPSLRLLQWDFVRLHRAAVLGHGSGLRPVQEQHGVRDDLRAVAALPVRAFPGAGL